jgi:hypothetical protein
LSSTDTLTCEFIFENNQGLTCTRNSVCEGRLSGTELQAALEGARQKTDAILVKTETGEWQFEQIGGVWVLRAVVIYASTPVLKQYVKDL